MFSSVPPITAPPFSSPKRNHRVIITASAIRLPISIATCGVLRWPWVSDSHGRK
ncbi:hypothetical protein D9M68_855970 [compost metagenome]